MPFRSLLHAHIDTIANTAAAERIVPTMDTDTLGPKNRKLVSQEGAPEPPPHSSRNPQPSNPQTRSPPHAASICRISWKVRAFSGTDERNDERITGSAISAARSSSRLMATTRP